MYVNHYNTFKWKNVETPQTATVVWHLSKLGSSTCQEIYRHGNAFFGVCEGRVGANTPHAPRPHIHKNYLHILNCAPNNWKESGMHRDGDGSHYAEVRGIGNNHPVWVETSGPRVEDGCQGGTSWAARRVASWAGMA